MERGSASGRVTILVLGLALLGLFLAIASLVTHRSMSGMMGGMMGGGTTSDPGTGGVEWAVLTVSAALFGATALLLLRARAQEPAFPPAFVPGPAGAPRPEDADASPSVQTLSELTLVKLLDEDERRMYLEIRERGGAVLQRDLVSMGTFSKPKVTRVLDKLERRGLVVRERHGMTNRVRIVARSAK